MRPTCVVASGLADAVTETSEQVSSEEKSESRGKSTDVARHNDFSHGQRRLRLVVLWAYRDRGSGVRHTMQQTCSS